MRRSTNCSIGGAKGSTRGSKSDSALSCWQTRKRIPKPTLKPTSHSVSSRNAELVPREQVFVQIHSCQRRRRSWFRDSIWALQIRSEQLLDVDPGARIVGLH